MTKLKNQKNKLEEFECLRVNQNCFEDHGNSDICLKSPCPLNLYRFGDHQRIIETYLNEKKWNNAFYYLRNLMACFPIDCNISQLNSILEDRRTSNKNIDKKSMPVGCQLYLEIDELSEIKNSELYYYEGIKPEETSEKGKTNYAEAKKIFSKRLVENLIRLEHLAISKREELRSLKDDREFRLKSIEAQMGELKPKSIETPINKTVEETITEKSPKEPNQQNPNVKPKTKKDNKKILNESGI